METCLFCGEEYWPDEMYNTGFCCVEHELAYETQKLVENDGK